MSGMSPGNFLEKIKYLLDEEKRIVTYKILSQELKVHVNKAKQYLKEYYEAEKKKGVELEVNYFLAGFVEMNGLRSVMVLVVPDDSVEQSKERFTELTSCHVYSIFKGVSKDLHALYSADYACTRDKDDLNKYSAIKHLNIELKPPILTKMPPIKDIKSTFVKKQEPKVTPNGSLPTDKKLVSPNETNSSKKDDTPKEKQEKGQKGNKTNSDAKSGTLVSMWQKKDQTSSAKTENTKPENKVKTTAKNVPKSNILSMFSKQAEKNAEKPPTLKPMPKESTKAEIESPEKEPSPKRVKPNENKKSSQKRKAANKNSKSSKSQQDSDSEGEFKSKPKKHKRICTFDSDSESEAEEEKEKAQRSFFLPEDPMETSVAAPVLSDDSEEPIPPTPPIIKVKGKAKYWKTVQKTYEDDDGYLVTKTEKELVSASDEEDPVKETKDTKKVAVEKKSPIKQKKKQASLMSFFKQK